MALAHHNRDQRKTVGRGGLPLRCGGSRLPICVREHSTRKFPGAFTAERIAPCSAVQFRHSRGLLLGCAGEADATTIAVSLFPSLNFQTGDQFPAKNAYRLPHRTVSCAASVETDRTTETREPCSLNRGKRFPR